MPTDSKPRMRPHTLSLLLFALPPALSVPYAAAEDTVSSLLPAIEVRGERALSDGIGQSRLNTENIDQQQADNVASLLDILPGTSMSGSPRPGGQTLNIWGFGDNEDIKISIDGAEKNFERYRQGSVFIEPELLRRVTVDKGPFDAARGNGGFGGAVRLESRDARDFLQDGKTVGGLVKSGYRSNDRQWQHSAAVFMQNRSGSLDMLLYTSIRRGHDIRTPDGSSLPFSANDQNSFLLKTNYRPSAEHSFSLSALYGSHRAWEPWAAKRGELPAPSAADISRYGLDEAWKRKLVYRRQSDQSYTVKYRYTPTDNPLLDLSVSFSHAKTRQHDRRPDSTASSSSFLGSMGHESHAAYQDTTLEIGNTARFATGTLQHRLQTGIRFNRHVRDALMTDKSPRRAGSPDYNYGTFQPYYMPSGSQQHNSFYIKDEIRFGNWTLTPALRYDHVHNQGEGNLAPIYNKPAAGHDYRSRSHRGWSPFLGLTWEVQPDILLFADISRTHRAPLIDEQYEVQSATSTAAGSSPHLTSEKLTALRIGSVMRWQNLLHSDDKLQLRTTLFHMRGRDEIFKNRGIFCQNQISSGSSGVCAKPIPNYRNLLGYTIRGGELEAYYESDRWFASLAYSFMHGKRQASPRNPWHNRDTWLSDIPPRKATATLGVRFPSQGLTLGWRGEFVRRQDRSPIDGDPLAGSWALPKSRGYALHGLFAAWQPPQLHGLTVRLTADNLFNRRYRPYLGEAVSGTGRNIKANIAWQF